LISRCFAFKLTVFLQDQRKKGRTFIMIRETGLRCDLVGVCRRLYARGLIAATDGNVSCRAGADRLLITPSGSAKGDLKPLDMLLTDLGGHVLQGKGRPSSEILMHLAVYEARPEVEAIVHAHPPMLTAFTLARMPFVAEALPEVWLTIGPVATAPYATPSTAEVAASIAPFLGDHQALLLERHGSLTLGKNLTEAYLRLEKLEHAAHTLFYAQLLGNQPPGRLPEAALAKLAGLACG
jgi:L-fuculose-phosphate aldolase